MSDKWDMRFLDLATHISEWSKDPSTKVGCVVVGPTERLGQQVSMGSQGVY